MGRVFFLDLYLGRRRVERTFPHQENGPFF